MPTISGGGLLFGLREARGEPNARCRSALQCTGGQVLLVGVEALPPLRAEPDRQYTAAPSGTVRLAHRGLPLDQIEDLLPKSSAYRQASAILFAQQADVTGRPLTPLHGGHVGLLCTAGMLNGIFGDGESRHIAHWQSVKLVDKSEEEEDGKTIIREKERFSNELTLVFCTGEIATLK